MIFPYIGFWTLKFIIAVGNRALQSFLLIQPDRHLIRKSTAFAGKCLYLFVKLQVYFTAKRMG